jgi:hypothetical protein
MNTSKLLLSVATGLLIATTFSGCLSSQPSIADMRTKDVKHTFVRGTTTSDSIRTQFGDPDEENIITYGEAKSMFKAKNQSSNGNPMDMMGQMMDRMQENQQTVVQRNADGTVVSTTGGKKSTDVEDSKEVEFWAYNDYEEERPSGFGMMMGNSGVKRKGAKLMLIWDDNNILKDYKFQKFNNN